MAKLNGPPVAKSAPVGLGILEQWELGPPVGLLFSKQWALPGIGTPRNQYHISQFAMHCG